MADNRSEIVFFDLETTVPARPGLGFSILEFGAILVCPRKLIELQSYSTLVCPLNLSVLDTKCERRNGITRDAVSVAPPFSAIADKVFDLLNGRIWAGHNILRFDCARIREAFAEIDRPPPEAKGIIDSLALLTERFGRRAGNMKMATLATYFGLGKQTHRSLDDVRMNLEVLKYCATVLLLESSLPDLLAGNSRVSPRTTRRTRSGERVLPVEISNTANLTSNSENVTTQTHILNLVEPIKPETEALRRLSEELTGDSIQENNPTEEQPMNESPPVRFKTEAFNMRRLSEELTGDSIKENNLTEEQPVSESPDVSHPPVTSEGCSSSSAFFTPDDVSISSINVSLFPFYRGSQRIRIMHNDVILKLLCTDMKVRFGISTKYVDQAGRPRLSFVVDAPPSLCKVLDACDNQAQKSFMQSCSLSEWRSVVSRKNGYWNFPTVRLQIPTILTGDVARYGTEIFQKKAPSGAEEKLQFINFNAAELESLFTPKTSIDAFFSLDPYDYHQNAGIRLVAEKLVIHSK